MVTNEQIEGAIRLLRENPGLADKVRLELAMQGIQLTDTREGTKWSRYDRSAVQITFEDIENHEPSEWLAAVLDKGK